MVDLFNGQSIKYVRDLLVDSSAGCLQSISINNGGTGYLTSDINTTFSITLSSAVNAVGAITAVSNGVVTGVALLEPASGYTTQSAGSATTSGGSGSGLTLNTVIVTGTGCIATLTPLTGHVGSGYATGDVVILNGSGAGGYGASATLTVTSTVVTAATILSSGSGYVVGEVYKTTTVTGSGSGLYLQVASVSTGSGIPRVYYCYDGIGNNLYTEKSSAGQIQYDFATLTTAYTGAATKYLPFPDNISTTLSLNTLTISSTNQPPQRMLLNANYVPMAAVARIYIMQEWFDASGTGILTNYTDAIYRGIDGPTYQKFSPMHHLYGSFN